MAGISIFQLSHFLIHFSNSTFHTFKFKCSDSTFQIDIGTFEMRALPEVGSMEKKGAKGLDSASRA